MSHFQLRKILNIAIPIMMEFCSLLNGKMQSKVKDWCKKYPICCRWHYQRNTIIFGIWKFDLILGKVNYKLTQLCVGIFLPDSFESNFLISIIKTRILSILVCSLSYSAPIETLFTFCYDFFSKNVWGKVLAMG